MRTCRWSLFMVSAAVVLSGCGGPQVHTVGTGGDSVRATVTYRESEPLPPDSELNVWIADVSPTPAATALIAEGTLPMRERETVFALKYDDDRIVKDHTYVLKASLRSGKEV